MLSKARLAEAVGSALAGNWNATHEIVPAEDELREIDAALGER